jgi:protein-S-isoprenylcysteine O-methyltransferase Ste14
MMRWRPRGARHWARAVVPALFAIAAAGKAFHSVGVFDHAVSQPTTRACLVALYALLQTSVALAFAVFTVSRAVPRKSARSPVAFVACAAAIAGVLAFEQPAEGTPEALMLMGEIVAIGSCAWLLVSVCFLGRCFGVLPEARGLVTRGPYSVVRHPVYLGEIGACAGLALAAPSPTNAFVLGTLVLAQAVRMHLEEQAVAAAFPEYAAYALRTPRLFPRLRKRPAVASEGARPRAAGLSASEATCAIVPRATSRA